jgi:hypothetical protein
LKHKKDLPTLIGEFIEEWGQEQHVSFMKDIIPLFELYNVDDENDWVRDEVGNDLDHLMHIRLIRTVYLVSKIAAHHAGTFCVINLKFRDLWKKMEKHAIGQEE